MKIETKLSTGDKAWIAGPTMGTVGMVRVEIIDSPGIPGEDLFDNYKPQTGYKEEYMLVETGIGSGSIYTYGKNIWKTREDVPRPKLNNITLSDVQTAVVRGTGYKP